VSQIVEAKVFYSSPAASCIPCPLIIDAHLSDGPRLGTVWPDTFFRMHEHSFMMFTNLVTQNLTGGIIQRYANSAV
jgi:hypothetical protein